VVGFQRHSVIYDDPQARLLRTDERMSRIYFGAPDEAEETGRIVQAMHRRVRGKTPAKYGPVAKGTRYDASDPQLGLWVLASLADSALVCYERVFGDLTQPERERYWSEYRRVGELLGLSWDPAREALLRSALLQLRLGARFWPDAIRLHPAARTAAGERYGAMAA
jgi:uncharacterized protein (DUF2236 family)